MIASIFLWYSLCHMQLHVRVQVERGMQWGQLTVGLRYDSFRSVQRGTQRVPMLSLHMSASCERDVSLRSVRVRRRWMRESSDILAVYAVHDCRRVAGGRQLPQSGFAKLSFRSLRIPAYGKEEISILADFSQDATVAGGHWLTVDRADDIAADGARVILVRGKGIVSQRRAAGGRTEGSARDADLQNLYLTQGRNRRVSTVMQRLDGDIARFVFSPPLLLGKYQEKLLALRADVEAESAPSGRGGFPDHNSRSRRAS